MNKRVKALNRLLRLQKDLYDLSMWRLNSLESKLQTLEAARHELINVKGSNPMYDGASGILGTLRLRSVERDVALIKESRHVLTQHVLTQGGRLRVVERLLKKADADYRSHMDRSQLSEIIERALHNKPSS